MSKASERLDLTDERIDRVAKAVDANALDLGGQIHCERIARREADKSLELSTVGAHKRIDEIGERLTGHASSIVNNAMRLCKIEQQPSGLGELGELRDRVDALDEWADEHAEYGNLVADIVNTNFNATAEKLAIVEQLASLAAARLLKAEGEIKAAHARASAAGSRWLGLNARLYVLEGIKNRGLFDRLWWLVFGE